ncbi:hypothetical protein BOQ62_03835 [Chryseobacterium sp. CH21]|uniref:hypothetical protein n=1 Tax=Chryseobacterium sp. CH21 TaxID=713556 RepID=UPI00100A7241|nr:hypothetical protein [Chryseobacterium sp. CH21]RXM40858.1 hypothetical protein BOQ62_03835 [Chryseobacterium sp. CH21]
MENSNRKEIFESYKKEIQVLKNKLFDKGFQTEDEIKKFETANKNDFDRYYFLVKEIEKLKYELMSPQEKKEYDEYMKKLKLKAEGKPLI